MVTARQIAGIGILLGGGYFAWEYLIKPFIVVAPIKLKSILNVQVFLNGIPEEDAEVTARSATQSFTKKTDENGMVEFIFDIEPDKKERIAIHARKDMIEGTSFAELSSGSILSTDVKLIPPAIKPTETDVLVTVYDNYGNLIDNATVTFQRGTETPIIRTTDINGVASVRYTTPFEGTIKITAEKNGYEKTTTSFPIKTGDVTTNILTVIAITPPETETVGIVIKVKDDVGKDVENATVTVRSSIDLTHGIQQPTPFGIEYPTMLLKAYVGEDIHITVSASGFKTFSGAIKHIGGTNWVIIDELQGKLKFVRAEKSAVEYDVFMVRE